MYKYKYKWKLKTHPLQGSQQTGTARLVGWRINPVAGGTITSSSNLFVYLYLRFNFYYICIWICFLTVFVFCQEQLPFVTNGVKNYSSCQHIFTTSWQIGPKIFNFDFHFLGRIPQRRAFTSIFCRQVIWTSNFLLFASSLFISSIFEQWTKYFGRQDIWTRNWGRERCLWSRTAVNRAEFAGEKCCC